MIRNLLVIFSLILSYNALAMTQPGDLILNGKISYSIHDSDNGFTSNGYPSDSERKTGKLYANTSIGYFISESVATGLGVKYEYSFTDYVNSSDDSTVSTTEGFRSIFSFVPFFTKYFKINDKFSISTSLELEAGFGDDEFDYDEKISTEIFKLGASISPAISYSLSNCWLISFSFGSIYYNWIKETLEDDSGYENIDNNFGIDLSLEKVYLGVHYIIYNKSDN